jgi:hypothetical protein
MSAPHRGGGARPFRSHQAELLHHQDLVVEELLLDELPSFKWATVQNSTLNDLPLGGITVPSGIVTGPLNVPVNLATEQVQWPSPNSTLYGRFPTRLSGKIVEEAIASSR